MEQPKFIITMDGFLRMGMVVQHKDLLLGDDQCIGGGYYQFDWTSNRLLLDRASYDFGRPRWHLLDRLKVPASYRGLRIVYVYNDDFHEDFNVSDELQIEYYDWSYAVMSKFLVIIDSFKGCLTSAEANQAAAEGILSLMPEAEVIQIPVSDGGEGWLEAVLAAMGGRMQDVLVNDPLMRPIVAQYLINGDTAVIEMAKASGLMLLRPEERNPMVASSYGTGQLVADAVRKGCRHIIVGLGGSATSDCGMGMLQAITDSFAPQGSWSDVHVLEEVRFTIASDVRNPLCGENGAAHVFAPQKGATPEMVIELDERARRFAEESALRFGYDRQDMPGAGAAGGLGYAFLQFLNADCRSGIGLLLDAVRFEEQLTGASLVITGEGSADRQTLMGKLPFGILQRANDVPVALIAGRIKDHEPLLEAGFSQVLCINPPDLSLEEAMKPGTAKRNIARTMKKLI